MSLFCVAGGELSSLLHGKISLQDGNGGRILSLPGCNGGGSSLPGNNGDRRSNLLSGNGGKTSLPGSNGGGASSVGRGGLSLILLLGIMWTGVFLIGDT